MGFMKSLGTVTGKLVGGAIGGTVSLVGDIIGSEFISDIGKGACAVTAHTGEVLGSFSDGALGCIAGIITQDTDKIKEGAWTMADTTSDYVMDMGKGIVNTAKLGVDGISAVNTMGGWTQTNPNYRF